MRDLAIGAAQRAVTNSGAAVYAIGMGTGKGAYVDLENLETLTANSGGYVEAISDPSEISAAVARMFDELQSQYMLAFEPAHADGKIPRDLVTKRTETFACARGRGIRRGRVRSKEKRKRFALFGLLFAFSLPLPVK